MTPLVPTAEFPASDDDPGTSWTWRRRLLVPVAALFVLGGASVGGLQLVGGGNDPAAEAAASTVAPGPAAPSSPAVQLVDLSPSTYAGRPVTEVQAELAARGLQVVLRPLTTADVPDGQVIAVDPGGALAPGTPVTVTYAVAPPAVSAATPEPAPAPALVVADPAPAQVAEPAPAPAPAPAPVQVETQTAVVGTTGSGTAAGSGGGAVQPEPQKPEKPTKPDKPAKPEKPDKPPKDKGNGQGKG